MVEIRSREALEVWLRDKPGEWAQVIAVRAAMRSLPFLSRADSEWLTRYAVSPLRAIAISWAGRFSPALNMADAANAANAANAADDAAYAAAYAASAAASASAYAAAAAAFAADVAYAAAADDAVVLWDAIQEDCDYFENNQADVGTAAHLSSQSLWHQQRPEIFDANWADFQRRLLTIDTSYSVWIEWFDRRIDGHATMFSIPGDKHREEDTKIVLQLAAATNEEFWDKGAVHVNTTLQSWLDEARARAAPPTPAILPPQNPNAIAFLQDANGKIAIDSSIDLNALRTDSDARDRHSELQRLATALKSRCQGSNAAARLTGLLENFVEALGDRNEDQRPSLLVQRGNRLDVEYRAYGDPAHLLSPLADDVLLDLGSLVSAIHMHVMSEPVLRDRATAMLGPDAKPVLIAPDEIKLAVQEADDRGILADGVREVVEEAADIAPAVPDPENRFTIWSTETLTNLIIEAFTIALRHPIETAIVGGVASILPTGLDLGTAVVAAGYLLHRREWVESRLGNSPTWKALFIELCNRMGKFIPPHE